MAIISELKMDKVAQEVWGQVALVREEGGQTTGSN